MKRLHIGVKTVVLTFFLSPFLGLFACDVCNAYISPSMTDNQSNIGLIYRYRKMHGTYNPFGTQIATKHAGHGNDPLFWSNDVTEHYHTFELRGSWVLFKRWKNTIILPYLMNSQYINADKRYNLNGIGDPTLISEYLVFKSPQTCNWQYRVNIGAGVKIPLGKTDIIVEDELPNLDLQPGSGSWDIIGSLSYFFQKNKLVISGVSTFKRNGFNADLYRYGKWFQ